MGPISYVVSGSGFRSAGVVHPERSNPYIKKKTTCLEATRSSTSRQAVLCFILPFTGLGFSGAICCTGMSLAEERLTNRKATLNTFPFTSFGASDLPRFIYELHRNSAIVTILLLADVIRLSVRVPLTHIFFP